MASLYHELSEKIDRSPGLTHRNGARGDLGLLLFAERDSLRDLWEAAERHLRLSQEESFVGLRDAVEKLRPLFGERGGPSGAGAS